MVYAAASRRLLDDGILLTRGEALAALTHVDTVVFDKTGTLTRGVPEICEIKFNPDRQDFCEREAIGIAAALEASSAHPIARAFREAREASEDAPPFEAGCVTVHPAQGLAGRIGDGQWRIGTAAFAGVEPGQESDDGIWLADERGWVARFELTDSLRPGAERTVRRLEDGGMDVVMLSGDGRDAVDRIAERLSIRRRHARQTPEMKLGFLDRLRKEGRRVLMVGDGVNDAPVLAAADVSMTVKGGAELANSAADMILTGESLGLVDQAMETARRARQLVRQNLTWAVLYNASVMPLAVSGTLKPWMAALGMSLSSLLVVANASRLVRKKERAAVGETSRRMEADAA